MHYIGDGNAKVSERQGKVSLHPASQHQLIHLDWWPGIKRYISTFCLSRQLSILVGHNDARPTKTNERWWPRVKGHKELCTQVITFTQSSIHIFIARTEFEFRIISHQPFRARILTCVPSREISQQPHDLSKYSYISGWVITFLRTSYFSIIKS